VIPDDFVAFFAAVAGASAALIGLLFVAISVAPQRLVETETRAESQTRAGSALIALMNVLIVATIALIPDVNIGWAAIAVGLGGLAYAAARGRVLLAERGAEHIASWLLMVVGLVVVFGWELVAGVRLLGSEHNPGAVTTIAALLVASLSIGVGRAWRLVGMHDTGIARSVSTLLHGD
jgi:hypothetical protein